MRSVAALLLFLPAIAVAQLKESVTVEIIEVPVHVTAPGGQPLRGLSRDAFELRVNGRVMPIEYFDAVDLPAPAADAAQRREETPNLPPRERRLYLLLFDTAYANPGKLARAQVAAEVTAGRSNPATDLFAVATYSDSRGVQFVTPFLSDRAVSLRAIHTLTVSRAADPLGMAMSSSERSEWLGATSEGDADYVEMGSGRRGDSGLNEVLEVGKPAILSERFRHVENLFENLSNLATRISNLEGQKHLLYFSSGFQSSLIHGGNSSFGHSPSAGGGLARPNRILGELSRAFAAAGVVIDAVDIDGIRPAGKMSSDAAESLGIVAQSTGGELVHNRNDLAKAVTDLTAAQRVVYILGFNRRNLRDGTISVRVNGVPSGTRLSYRTGFGAAASKKEVDPLQLIDVLVNDLPQHDVTTRLTVAGSTAALELHPAEFADAKEIEALLYVFNADGTAVAGYTKRIAIAQKAPIVLRQKFALPPGRYVAKAVVRIAGTASLGFSRTEFTVE